MQFNINEGVWFYITDGHDGGETKTGVVKEKGWMGSNWMGSMIVYCPTVFGNKSMYQVSLSTNDSPKINILSMGFVPVSSHLSSSRGRERWMGTALALDVAVKLM
jgi:hypothetical protein